LNPPGSDAGHTLVVPLHARNVQSNRQRLMLGKRSITEVMACLRQRPRKIWRRRSALLANNLKDVPVAENIDRRICLLSLSEIPTLAL